MKRFLVRPWKQRASSRQLPLGHVSFILLNLSCYTYNMHENPVTMEGLVPKSGQSAWKERCQHDTQAALLPYYTVSSHCVEHNCRRVSRVCAPRLIHQVLDTNVVLNQMDLLDNPSPALSCVIVLQTVMQVRGFVCCSMISAHANFKPCRYSTCMTTP